MAKKISYTDQYGDVFPEAYFRAVQVNLCKEDKTGNIVFYGFENEAKKGKRVIGAKSYNVKPVDYDAYFSATVLDPEGINPLRKAYDFADSVLDVDSGEVDGDGNKIMVSFFDGAEDV